MKRFYHAIIFRTLLNEDFFLLPSPLIGIFVVTQKTETEVGACL